MLPLWTLITIDNMKPHPNDTNINSLFQRVHEIPKEYILSSFKRLCTEYGLDFSHFTLKLYGTGEVYVIYSSQTTTISFSLFSIHSNCGYMGISNLRISRINTSDIETLDKLINLFAHIFSYSKVLYTTYEGQNVENILKTLGFISSKESEVINRNSDNLIKFWFKDSVRLNNDDDNEGDEDGNEDY